ncbi:MAG TPA: (2Fe-2S) ferredoxin domain-containing protein [Nitrospiria bacterium]|jgi:(2Fe-2S) ferredoxin
MPKPKYHVIVCTNSRPSGHPRGSCGEKGGSDVMMQFYEEMQNLELFDQVLITGSTCTGPCQLGPIVIVYPDGTWYQKVTQADVKEIMEEHIGKGKPVDRLKVPDNLWG